MREGEWTTSKGKLNFGSSLFEVGKGKIVFLGKEVYSPTPTFASVMGMESISPYGKRDSASITIVMMKTTGVLR